MIRDQAVRLGAPFFEVKRENTEILRNTRTGIDFSMKNGYYENTIFSIPFIAGYQVMNAALAVKTLEVLRNQAEIPADAVKKGLAETRWQGGWKRCCPV